MRVNPSQGPRGVRVLPTPPNAQPPPASPPIRGPEGQGSGSRTCAVRMGQVPPSQGCKSSDARGRGGGGGGRARGWLLRKLSHVSWKEHRHCHLISVTSPKDPQSVTNFVKDGITARRPRVAGVHFLGGR